MNLVAIKTEFKNSVSEFGYEQQDWWELLNFLNIGFLIFQMLKTFIYSDQN